MTPARKAALQWFHDRGEVTWFRLADNPPSDIMCKRLMTDGLLQRLSQGNGRMMVYSLTDKGRRMLHGDPR